jgi:hypothetical protein
MNGYTVALLMMGSSNLLLSKSVGITVVQLNSEASSISLGFANQLLNVAEMYFLELDTATTFPTIRYTPS